MLPQQDQQVSEQRQMQHDQEDKAANRGSSAHVEEESFQHKYRPIILVFSGLMSVFLLCVFSH
jgi:hypothetical protein